MQLGDMGKHPVRTVTSAEIWTHPPQGFYKLNFNGASKGKPSPFGYGCISRDHRGNMQGFKYGYLGW